MKRILAAMLGVLLCFSLLPAVSAVGNRDLSGENDLASGLEELGLFLGVGEGADGTADFALDRALSRVEAVTMLARALGKGAQAEAQAASHPFTDVPEWADGYVSYAYEQGLTKGVSATEFGSEQAASAEMYLTFMLRALGYAEGKDGDFTWDMPWVLATWCGILPAGVSGTDFLRADAVDVTCAALFAHQRGTGTTLHERLAAEGAFTEEQFERSFPADPFARDRAIHARIREAAGQRVRIGLLENTYGTECHLITDMEEAGGVLSVSFLICHSICSLPRENVGWVSGSGTSDLWQIDLDAETLALKTSRTAGELLAAGRELEDYFPETSLAARNALRDREAIRTAMWAVNGMAVQLKLDSGEIAYRQPSYAEALAKVKGSLSEVTETLETEVCTVLLGRATGEYDRDTYRVYLIYKAGSAIGEGETYICATGAEPGELSIDEDGTTLHYAYRFVDGNTFLGLPPTGGSITGSGTVRITIDLMTGNSETSIESDGEAA